MVHFPHSTLHTHTHTDEHRQQQLIARFAQLNTTPSKNKEVRSSCAFGSHIADTHTHTHTNICTHAHKHMHTCTQTYAHMHTNICTHAHTNISTHAHTGGVCRRHLSEAGGSVQSSANSKGHGNPTLTVKVTHP